MAGGRRGGGGTGGNDGVGGGGGPDGIFSGNPGAIGADGGPVRPLVAGSPAGQRLMVFPPRG
jgi:hypothetical protein